MDTSPSDEIVVLKAQVREYLDREVLPLEQTFCESGLTNLHGEVEQKRREVRKLGLWAPQLPKRTGGLGLGLVDFAHISEELGRSPLGHYVFNCQAPDAGNMELLLEFGSKDQRIRFLDPLAGGEARSCFTMTEPGRPGSNPTWMETVARPVDNGYAISGRKWFSSAADGALFAVVMAVTDAEAAPHERATMFLVPTDSEGFRVERNSSVMGHEGEGWASHGEVVLEDVFVPQQNVLGKIGSGFRLAQARLGPGRIHHCMRWVGVAERAFDLMCARAVARELKPGEVLGQKQTVQTWIAESRASINAARLMVLDAAAKMEREGTKAAREEVSLIKFFVADVMLQVVDRALQLHGALGMTDQTPLAYFYRHERAARIYDGPDEVHKEFVAGKILQRYGLRR